MNLQSLNETILSDIHRLKMRRHGRGPIPEGQRDLIVFWAANYTALSADHDALPDALGRLRDRLVATAWSDTELWSRTDAVLKRAALAAAGVTIGHTEPPRVCRRLSGLNHAAMFGSSCIA